MNKVLRQEKKYLLSVPDGQKLYARLSSCMVQDEHNGPHGYLVRSLYFDSLNDGDYWDKVNGVELRQKLRLRVYSPEADFAMLEMKQKEGACQKKRSLRVSREDARRLCRGDYGPLLKYHEPFAAECYGMMRCKCYQPKTVVEYRRRAFLARENHIRITLDSHITATEAHWDVFAPDLARVPVLDPFNLILEIKYTGFLLSYIKELAGTANRSELAQSKYCLARSVGLRFQS